MNTFRGLAFAGAKARVQGAVRAGFPWKGVDTMQFAPVRESQVSRAIAREFFGWFDDFITCDAIVVGAGPSGLVAAYDLARNHFKTLVVECNNYLGGGFWIGGFLMNTLTFRSPAHEILDELRIPYRWVQDGLAVADGPLACSLLIAAACSTGARVLNVARFEDLVLRNGRVEGVVVNWAPVAAMPRQITCVDPIALESKVVIDATGHDARVCQALQRRGLLQMKDYCGAMDVEESEGRIVEHTREVFPGLIVAGMAVATVFGLPRMGPTFGAMLHSGRRAASIAAKLCAPVPAAASV
jgi:thiamine thiazole synthase